MHHLLYVIDYYWYWVRVSVSGKCVVGVWFIIKQHDVLKVMIIMSCIRILYKSVLSIYYVPFL